MDRWQNRVAVVTGASSGIGKATARALAEAGLQVVALGRRQERLDKNRSELPADLQKHFYVRKCDVSSEDDVKTTFEWIEKTLGGPDILINNAGISGAGNLVEMDTDHVHKVINTNVNGLIYCTQAAFKSMKQRKFDGHIVHINSIAGHEVLSQQNISFNIYPASKFAVTAINETIRNEMRNLGTKVKTTSISPGAVRTDIAPKSVFDSLGDACLKPEDIAQAVLFAISTPPHVQIHEMTVKPVGEKF